MNPIQEKRKALGYCARCSDAPDYSGMNAAAEANAAVSKEALDFYRQVYAEQKPAREAAAKIAMDVANQQLESSRQNTAISNDYWNYQKNTSRATSFPSWRRKAGRLAKRPSTIPSGRCMRRT